MSPTHYERLRVQSHSTPEEIRLAYLRQARANHPDTLSGADPAALRDRERSMVAINAAWFVLGDPDRRRIYDQALEREADARAWEDEEQYLGDPQEYDWRHESPVPREFGAHGNPAAGIARLYVAVMIAVAILLAIAFSYAVIGSGSVGMNGP